MMNARTLAGVGLGIALLTTPFLASADTVGDVQQQIQNLLAQVRALQTHLIQVQFDTSTATSSGPVACTMEAKQCPDGTWVGRSGPNCSFAPCGGNSNGADDRPAVCPMPMRSLARGMQGDDVKAMQQFLGVQVTGFFGPATQQAVMQFQQQEGLSTAGVVGPQTRAALARRCRPNGTNTTGTSGGESIVGHTSYANTNTGAQKDSGALHATILNGLATDVHFTYADQTSGHVYVINFGDGDGVVGSALMPHLPGTDCFKGPCETGYMANHSYLKAGTYTATVHARTYDACVPQYVHDCANKLLTDNVVASMTITAAPTR